MKIEIFVPHLNICLTYEYYDDTKLTWYNAREEFSLTLSNLRINRI